MIIYTNKQEQVDVSQQGALFPTEALSFGSKEYLLIPRFECSIPVPTHEAIMGPVFLGLFFAVLNFLLFPSNSFARNLHLIKVSALNSQLAPAACDLHKGRSEAGGALRRCCLTTGTPATPLSSQVS